MAGSYHTLLSIAQALLTLNSCPMFTFNGRDAHRSLTAARLHLPIKQTVSDILPEREKTDDDEADPALLRLPAPGLRGTWSRAYNLLTKLVSQIGWDELLKTRSAVFVMEEEYRMQKAQSEISAAVGSGSMTAMGNGGEAGTGGETNSVVDSLVSGETTLAGHVGADDDASIRGVRSSESKNDVTNGDAMRTPSTGGYGHTATLSAASAGSMGIPTIRISTESSREARAQSEFAKAAAEYDARSKKSMDSAADTETEMEAGAENEANGHGEKANMDVNGAALQQPAAVQAAVGGEAGESEKEDGMGAGSTAEKEPFSFSNKRLCERWLDNLFMVLYEVRSLSASSFPRSLAKSWANAGSSGMDHFPRRSRSLQDSARSVSQDGNGVGDPR